MPPTLDTIRKALDAEEPDYASLAARFGAEAIPHLAELARLEDPLIGPKAIALAVRIAPKGSAHIVQEAANRSELWRVAAAAAAAFLSADEASPILSRLVMDGDLGVRRVAIESTPLKPSAELVALLRRRAEGDPSPYIRKLALDTLERVGQ